MSSLVAEFVTAVSNAIDNDDLNELQRLLNIDNSVINKKYKGDTAIMKSSRQCNGNKVVAFLLHLCTFKTPILRQVIF
uniref:Uncharacterized protein n=1 Tax=viral metagenome TaxID=1070528 RepID=A0A6C0I738_9ZZZZ